MASLFFRRSLNWLKVITSRALTACSEALLRVYYKSYLSESDDHSRHAHDTAPRHLKVDRIAESQPETDIKFKEIRVGEGDLGQSADDVITTTDWRPRLSKRERRRLTAYDVAPDLKHVPYLVMKQIERLSDPNRGAIDIQRELLINRFGQTSRKLQASVRSKVAGASMRGVPLGAALLVTIDIGAFPPLDVWHQSGGTHATTLVDRALNNVDDAFDSIGCAFLLKEGFFETALAPTVELDDPRRSQFVKSYADQHWPSTLRLSGYADQVFVPHFHWVIVPLDEDGKPIPADVVSEALKRRFSSTRAIHVEPITYSNHVAKAKAGLLGAAVEAAMRYAVKRKGEVRDQELREQARWLEALEPDDIWTGGWTTRIANTKPKPIMVLASLLGRSKMVEALEGFIIPAGHRQRLIAARQGKLPVMTDVRSPPHPKRSAPSTEKHYAVNDNATPVRPGRRCRDGPEKIAA